MINTFWGYVTGASTPPPLSPGRGRSRTTSPKTRKPDYSITYLQDQIEELLSITGPPDGPQSSIASSATDRLVELIRSIAETLLWGEQNEDDSMMFDYFAEKGVMRIFVSLLNSATVAPSTTIFGSVSTGSRQITIQLLQTMSLLLLNVKRQTSLYFLLSNNAVNQLINNNNNLDFSDEEILSYYISFMKSISLRLSSETINFFVNERTPNYFPLFSQSIRFFDHHDRMIRIAVRTITLAIFKLYVDSVGLQKFIQDNSGGYFSLLACQLRDLWNLMDRTTDVGTLQTITDEMIDQLEYVAEIDRLEIGAISDLLIEKLRLYALNGVLVKGLLQNADGSDSPRLEDDKTNPSNPQSILSLRVSLFVLVQLVDTTKSDIWAPLVIQFLSSEESRARCQSEIKNLGPCFPILAVLFETLLSLPNNKMHNEMSEFGLMPPKSIDMIILVAQSISKSIDSFSVKTCSTAVGLVETFLKNPIVDSEFKRPVKLTLIDSFRNCSARVSQLINDSVIPLASQGNEMNYSVVDDVESALISALRSSSSVSRTDVDELLLWKPSTRESGLKLTHSILYVFFELLIRIKRIDNSDFSIEKVRDDIFGKESTEWADAQEINSPPTPPPDDEAGTLTTGPLPENVEEGDLVDLGKRDRIFCSFLRPTGKSTRYLVLDKTRLILVAPDLVRPGYAVVKLVRSLRVYSAIYVQKDDQKVLVLERAFNKEKELLGFEDIKRCHLALMHLETKRIELRKQVYQKIDSMLRGLVHFPST